MKEDSVTRQVRVVRKQQGVQPLAPNKRHLSGTDIRQERIERRARKSSSRRDQVAPTDARMQHEKSKRRSSKQKSLRVDAEHSTATPGLRSNDDLRSPGQRKSPVAQQDEQPIPDFITQTDRYGNATTPRSSQALAQARREHPWASPNKQTEDSDDSHVEACAETFLDSLRLVCCCLAPEEEAATTTKSAKDAPETKTVSEKENVPRLLPPPMHEDTGKKCLVLDLDETLVHSSFRAVPGADFIIPVQIEDVTHFVYVCKRPGVDEFLVEMAKYYEIVIYTASLNKYADPLLDLLDPHRTIRYRLFRESCVYYQGNYVKDMSLIDRDLSQSIIVDNSPNSYLFHPENAIDCSSFIDDPRDRELDQIAAFLKGIKDVKDVRGVCSEWREWPHINLEGQ